jgi:hypothetical protein
MIVMEALKIARGEPEKCSAVRLCVPMSLTPHHHYHHHHHHHHIVSIMFSVVLWERMPDRAFSQPAVALELIVAELSADEAVE